MEKIKMNKLIGKTITSKFQGDSKLYVFGINKKENAVLVLWKMGIGRIKVNHITNIIN